MTTPEGLYYEGNIPLNLKNTIQDYIGRQRGAANLPQVQQDRADREWFSQARPATGESQKPTLFTVRGTGGRSMQQVREAASGKHPDYFGNFESIVGSGVDPELWDWVDVSYPGDVLNLTLDAFLNMDQTSAQGTQNLIDAINRTAGKFALCGMSQGAIVVSNVYDEIRYGSLRGRRGDFIGATVMGNPRRQRGYTIPGGIDPGAYSGGEATHGACTRNLLADCEPELWWDFANPNDFVADIGDSQYDKTRSGVLEFVLFDYNGPVFGIGQVIWDALRGGLVSTLEEVFNLVAYTINLLFLAPEAILALFGVTFPRDDGHFLYDKPYANLPGNTASAVNLAIARFNRIGAVSSNIVPKTVTEVLQVNFKLPLSVSEISFQALRVPCTATVWYLDRHSNWIQMRDAAYNPITVTLGYSSAISWYHATFGVYPIVANAVQVRLTRNADGEMGNQPYVVGLKDLLVRRNVYTRTQGTQALNDQEDSLGNVITKYIKDWDASKTIDDGPNTFWKSAPLPDPMAVACLYLDVRDPGGTAQIIDSLYIDPVYSGQSLNLYYSNDDNQGSLDLSPVNLLPETNINTAWRATQGLLDSTNPSLSGGAPPSNSAWLAPASWGPMVSKPIWIGIEWAPDWDLLDAGNGPPQNPVLFSVVPDSPTENQYWPTVSYEVGSNKIVLQLQDGNGSHTVTYHSSPLTPLYGVLGSGTATGGSTTTLDDYNQNWLNSGFKGKWVTITTGTTVRTVKIADNTATRLTLANTTSAVTAGSTYSVKSSIKGAPIQIVVGWVYGPNAVHFSATQRGTVLMGTTITTSTAVSSPDSPASALPPNVSLDGRVGYGWSYGDTASSLHGFRGLMSALVVKQEAWSSGETATQPGSAAQFQTGPTTYANPDPIQPLPDGTIPSTTLTNALLACDWTSQQFPIGGAHKSLFDAKFWTPILANYTTQKGKLYFPRPLPMKYLKLEFSNLTPEPYPVYDAGIKVSYETFPVTVIQAATQHTGGLLGAVTGLLTLASEIITGSLGSVNWLNPTTVRNAINAAFGNTQAPVQVFVGPGSVTGSIPNTAQSGISKMSRSEQTSPWVYRRTLLNPSYLVGHSLNTISGSSPDQTVIPSTSRSSVTVGETFAPVTTVSHSNVLPQRGADWWLFPGANLKMSANVMNGLTGCQVVTNRGPSSATRIRWTTASTHRYDIKTVTLDAAIAYFAGLRDVQALCTTYIANEDHASFSYPIYNPAVWTYSPSPKYVRQLKQESNQADSATNYPGGKNGKHPTYAPAVNADGTPYVFPDEQVAASSLLGPLSTTGTPYRLTNTNFALDLSGWSATGNWYWDSLNGLRVYEGGSCCAGTTADGTDQSLVSSPVSVAPGDQIIASAWVRFVGVTSLTAGSVTDNLDKTVTTASGAATDNTDGSARASDIDAVDRGDGTAVVLTIADQNDRTVVAPNQIATDYLDGTALVAAGTVVEGNDGTASTTAFFTGGQLSVTGVAYNSGVRVGTVDFTQTSYVGRSPIYRNPQGDIDGGIYYQLIGAYTVPSAGVDSLAVSLNVNGDVQSGTIYFASPQVNSTKGTSVTAQVSNSTQSNFNKLLCKFSDSGLVRSDSMWARLDPLDLNIDNLKLSYYVTVIGVPPGFWDDTFAQWEDQVVDWGNVQSSVAAQIDGTMTYNGQRSLRFSRPAQNSSKGGIQIVQQLNFVSDGLFRLSCVYYMAATGTDTITLRLVRISDNVVIHQEDNIVPVVGYWYLHQGEWVDIPHSTDQVYRIELELNGSDASDIYVNDLYTEIAAIRYIVQLGAGVPIDVTPLAYSENCNISCTVPVNSFTASTVIYSPHAYAYGCEFTPKYLQ